MVQQLLTPDVVSWSAVLSACENGTQWEGALGLLREMVHQLLTSNVVSWSAVLSACENSKQCEEALGLLHEMPW